jgi:O-acetyl-ADP-ribose deacetylase
MAQPHITLVRGDITQQDTDAIVNAANSSLLGGGGVDGAIHRAGGPEILEACRALRASHYGRGLPTGQAVATTAGRLRARWVIHTVGPVYAPSCSSSSSPSSSRTEDRSALLAACHTNSLAVADSLGAKTVAFPAISTGIFGWPMADAARIAIATVRAATTEVEEVRFVLFDESAYQAFAQALTPLT